MQWPLEKKPTHHSEVPFYNLHYLYACTAPSDPTMVWGSEIDAEALQSYVRERNRHSHILLSVAHVLLQAVGRALAEHPQLNCRVVGRRIHRFREVNVRMMMYNKQFGEVDVVLIKNADTVGLERLARILWKNQCKSQKGDSPDNLDKQALRRWPEFLLRQAVRAYFWLDRNFRLPKTGKIDRIASAPVLVNYLGFPGAPPMRSYKPSNHPDESSHLSVTMGRTEWMPRVCEGQVVARPIAPLFIRADHRLADAYLMGQFLSTLRKYLAAPTELEELKTETEPTEEGQKAA